MEFIYISCCSVLSPLSLLPRRRSSPRGNRTYDCLHIVRQLVTSLMSTRNGPRQCTTTTSHLFFFVITTTATALISHYTPSFCLPSKGIVVEHIQITQHLHIINPTKVRMEVAFFCAGAMYRILARLGRFRRYAANFTS